MSNLQNKIKELQQMCFYYNLILLIKYMNDHEVCFVGLDDDDIEVFNVCIHIKNNKKLIDFEINTKFESYRSYSFRLSDILLLTSLYELSTDDLLLTTIKEDLK